ncbi:ribonuclease Oy-like [Glandiceps talaboti]
MNSGSDTPKSKTMLLTLTVIVTSLVLCVECRSVTSSDLSVSTKFDYLIFAQQWTQSFCVIQKQKSADTVCRIPNGVSTWTVHGLWPSHNNISPPLYCDNSSKFDGDEVKTLFPELQQYWPDLLPNKKKGIWDHEWMKHGTCGQSLESINSQYKYFETSLILNRAFDISYALSKHGIYPSDEKSYPCNDVVNAMLDTFGSTSHPQLGWYRDENSGKTYLYQVSFCLDKDLKLQDCKKLPWVFCPSHLNVYIPTIIHS